VNESQRDELVANLAAAHDLVEWLIDQPPAAEYNLAIVLLERARWRAEQALAEERERGRNE
jgi:hypothetical protein